MIWAINIVNYSPIVGYHKDGRGTFNIKLDTNSVPLEGIFTEYVINENFTFQFNFLSNDTEI